METATQGAARHPVAPTAADVNVLRAWGFVSEEFGVAAAPAAAKAVARDSPGAVRAVPGPAGSSGDAVGAPAESQDLDLTRANAAAADARERAAAADKVLPGPLCSTDVSAAVNGGTRTTAGDLTTTHWGGEGKQQQQQQRTQRLMHQEETQEAQWQQQPQEEEPNGLQQLLQEEDEQPNLQKCTSRHPFSVASLLPVSRRWTAWWRRSSSSDNKQEAAAADCVAGGGDAVVGGSYTEAATAREPGGEAFFPVENCTTRAEQSHSPVCASTDADADCSSSGLLVECGPRLRAGPVAPARPRVAQVAAGAAAAAASETFTAPPEPATTAPATAARQEQSTTKAKTGIQRIACAATSLSPSSRRVEMAARGTSAAVADMPAEKAHAEPTGAPASLTAGVAPELPADAAANAVAATAAAGVAEGCGGFNRWSSTSVSRRRARRCPFAVGLKKPAAAAAGLLQQVASAQRAAEGALTEVETATGTEYGMAREEAAPAAADDDAGAVLACSATEGGRTMADPAKCPKDAAPLLKVDAARSTTETTATTSFFYTPEEGRECGGWWTCRATTGGRRSTKCGSAVDYSSRTNGSSREDDSGWRSTSRSKINSRARKHVTRSSKRKDRDRCPEQSSSSSSSSTTDKHDVQQRGSSAGSSTRWWIRNKNSSSRVGNARRVMRSSSSQSSETLQRRQSGSTEDSSRRTSLLSSGSRSSSEGEKPGRRRMFLPGSLKNSSGMAMEERCGGDGSISSAHAFEEASGTVVGCGGSKAASVSLPCSRCHDWLTARGRESNRNSVCCEYLESAEETSSGCLGMGAKHQRCSRSSSRKLEEWCRSPSASSGGEKDGKWRVGSCERLLRQQERFKRPGCGLPLRSHQQEEQVRQPQQDLAKKHWWCPRLLVFGRQGQPQHQPCASDASPALVRLCCTFVTAGDTDREAAVVSGETDEKATASLEAEVAAAQVGALAAAGGGSAAAYATGAAAAANEEPKPEQRTRKQQGQENVGRLQNVLRSLPAAATTKRKQDPLQKKRCFIEFFLPHTLRAGKELLQHQKPSKTAKRGGFMGVFQHCHLSSTRLPLRLWRCIHAFSTAVAKKWPPLHARDGGSHASGAEAATKQTGELFTLREHAATSADSTPAATTKEKTTKPPNPAATHWPPSSGSDFIENQCSERGCREPAEVDIAEPSAGRDAGWWTAAEEEEADGAVRPCCLPLDQEDDEHRGQRQQQVLARRQGEQKNNQQGHVQRSQQQRQMEKDEETRQRQLTLMDQRWRILDVLSYILRRSDAPVAAHADEACATSSSGDCVERQRQSEAAGPAGTGPSVCLPQHPSSYCEEVEMGARVSGWSSIPSETAAYFSDREGCKDGRLVNAEAPGGTTKATKGEAALTADALGDSAPGKETQGAGQRGKCSVLTWTRRTQRGLATGECGSCEEPGTAEGENASRAQLVCRCSLASAPAITAPDCCVSSKRTNARVREAAATALSGGAPAASARTAGAAQAAADLHASASRSAQTLAGGELQAAKTVARQVDTARPASDASPAVGATRGDNRSVRIAEGQLTVRRSRQGALAAWSRSGVTRGSAVAAVLSMLYLLLQMPCSTKTAVVWLVLLSSCFTLGVRLLRLVQRHGLVVLLPTPLLRVLEENRLMDIIYVQLASGRLSFYISRMLLLLFAHPTREEALSLLEGWHPAVVKLLTGRGLREALPQQLLRPLYGQAAASTTWDDDAVAMQRVRLAAAPAAFHMQPAGLSDACEEASAGSAGAAGLQPLPVDAPCAWASHVEASLAVRAAFGLRDAAAEETVHRDPAEPSAAAAVVPHTVVVGRHRFGSSGSDKGFSQTGSDLHEGNMHELLQRNIRAERLGGSPAAAAPARGRQGNQISRATAACKHSCSRMREEHFQDAESEDKGAHCSTDTASRAKSGSAAEPHEPAGRLHAEQLQDMRRITAQTQTRTVELLTGAHHQLLSTRPQHKQKHLFSPSACERELLYCSQEQQQPTPPGTPDSKRGGAPYADEASQILLRDSELSAARRVTCAPPPTAAVTTTRASACARATDFFAVPCPFSLSFKLPRCFGWPQGKPFRETASQRQKGLAGGVGALAGAAAAADVCVSGERVAGGATTALPGEGSAASAAAAGCLAAGGIGSDLRDRIRGEKQRPDISHTAMVRAPPPCSSTATAEELLPASSQAESPPLGEDRELSTPWAAYACVQSPPVLYEPSRLSGVHLQASTEICKLPLRMALPAWLARLLRLRHASKLHSEEATPACLQHEQLLQEPYEALWKQPGGVLLQEQQQEIERLPHRQLLQRPLQQQQARRELVAVGEAVEEAVASSSSSDWQDDGLLHEVVPPRSDREQMRNVHSLGNEDLHIRVCKEALQRFLRQHFCLPVSDATRSRQ